MPTTTAAHVAADVAVVLVAAGSGTRFGSDKIRADLGGKPLWRWSYDTFRAHRRVKSIIVVGPLDVGAEVVCVAGGDTRQDSVRNGVSAVPPDAAYILVHDAARPFVDAQTIDLVIAGCEAAGAAAPVVPVIDTLRSTTQDLPNPDRSKLVAMQTPQGARAELLRQALGSAANGHTDEISVLEASGANWQMVDGSTHNFKVTVPDDLARARQSLRLEVRTGLGYDIHTFSSEPGRPLWLGGVHFPDHLGLEGHSDADALLHAITDAVLGAAVMGDIGQHFPPGEAQWKNKPSLHFLEAAGRLVREAGWSVTHIDSTVIAETPKVMVRAEEIRGAIGQALELEPDNVSVKATTNERLGAIGRGEGIAAFATATLERYRPA